ncbi:hypothetical protein HY412_01420 [Candidatus Kaiserbacteria bacterium]|nr:hypothetical protein [Candidatus Kaiserbacteria bacterium]
MDKLFKHIEKIKGQPHNIRKQIAFGAAFAGTAVIALIWLVSTVGSGTFALKPTSFADSVGGGEAIVVSGDSSVSGIAGAASAVEDKNAPARIEIIDTASSTRPVKKAEQTVIPF